MSNPVLLIADPNTARLAALIRRCEARAGVTVLGAATPGEAYMLIESHLPRRVAFSAEFAEAVEFDGLADILTMIDADVSIFGPLRHRTGRHRQFATPDEMLAHLFGGLQPARGPLRAEAPAAPASGPVGSVILMGASTGGITALETVLSQFRADCPPTLIVQHIRPGFAEGLVRRLDQLLTPRVVAARDGDPLQRGTVYLACEADRHMGLIMRGGPRIRMIAGAPVSGHRPSVDVLFSDGAALADRLEVRAALLTGMGADGAQGMGALRRAGGLTIAQDRDSSVVWGMPRVAAETGAASEILPLSRIGKTLLTRESQRLRRMS
ncbi:chemotaxis protein CheB [Paracoccus aestuarii]|uniref:protein-glutamate methylesterase n=1 Tax=Paracoccus aestuarii TaxID=453842 RepID=A0A418ZU65_9RHOB|nr:CheB methylesterase domain-containing protein [Paracoccus aestuarii]RJL02403.1 chemotaxis protein CheB [Paracoccus aestuarii]WCR00331.1 chemotaxis protein CheB [Paracoccus aestuarii]